MPNTTLSHKTLNDFAEFVSKLAPGETEVYYMVDDHPKPRDYRCGDAVDVLKLSETHKLLGKIAITDLEEVFFALQGENWSPNGEANGFIRSKGLWHTSMSIGDVVKVGGNYYAVAGMGFNKIG